MTERWGLDVIDEIVSVVRSRKLNHAHDFNPNHKIVLEYHRWIVTPYEGPPSIREALPDRIGARLSQGNAKATAKLAA